MIKKNETNNKVFLKLVIAFAFAAVFYFIAGFVWFYITGTARYYAGLPVFLGLFTHGVASVVMRMSFNDHDSWKESLGKLRATALLGGTGLFAVGGLIAWLGISLIWFGEAQSKGSMGGAIFFVFIGGLGFLWGSDTLFRALGSKARLLTLLRSRDESNAQSTDAEGREDLPQT